MSQQSFFFKDVLHIKDVAYEVVRVLPDKLQLANQVTGELRDETPSTLLQRYTSGEVRIEASSIAQPSNALGLQRPNSDTGLERLSEVARDESIRRLDWLTRIESMGGFERPKTLREAILRVAEIRGEAHPPHVSTLYRWRRKFRCSKNDPRALFARLDRRGGRGKPRFDPAVEACITDAIDSIFLKQKRASAAEVHRSVALSVSRLNQMRSPTEQLPTPSLRSIQYRIARIYSFDVAVSRHGLREANRKLGTSIASRPVQRILQVVEIDQTPVDLWCVDEAGKVIGKPTLTLILDRFSRCVVGFFLSLDGLAVDTAFGAVRHALLPKSYLKERYPEIQNDWPCYGWFEKLLADNGSIFASKDLQNAILNLGMILEFCAAYEPNDKPHVERFFRTFNYGFIHHLKGTSLAKVSDRKGEQLQADACITLAELERLIHIWIVDVYHQRPHAGLDGRSPDVTWSESAESFPPRLKANVDTIDIELSEVDVRALNRGGIAVNSNRYSSERLGALQRMLPSTSTVTIKHRRANVGHIYVRDPFAKEYFRVDNVKSEKEGLSLQQDQFVRNKRKGNDPDSLLQIAAAEEIVRDKVEELSASNKTSDRKQAAKIRGDNSDSVRKHRAPKTTVSSPDLSDDIFSSDLNGYAEEVN